MSRKIPQLWAKKGRIQVSDVGWGYFVVKFETIGDYERAMFGGPWMVVLTIIGDRIGKTVRLDHTTLEGSRGNFARVCVEVDLSKPLLSKYRLRRRVRRVEYEGLHTIFYSCGCYGHGLESCPNKEEEGQVVEPTGLIANPVFQSSGFEELRPKIEEYFGPWMKVTRSSRKGQKHVGAIPVPANPPSKTPSPAAE
ncbi:hypothetical protein LINPERHAP2_LOCUS14393 [Linum perenne]